MMKNTPEITDNSKRNLVENQLNDCGQSGEILSDVRKSGKPKPWKSYKQQSLAVSDAYGFFQYLEKYAHTIADCGAYLRFKSCSQGHYKKLILAYFCKCRLCVMCQWRKSLVMYHQVFTLIHAHRAKFKLDVPLLLTLTVPNVSGDQLNQCLNEMQKGFQKLMKRRGIKRAARSWFRSLEITYNGQRDDYHPHYHVLLLVPEAYFKRDRGLYLDQSEWLSLWQESMEMPEITQVDVRRVRKRTKGQIEGIAAEVAKYATKPSTYVKKQSEGDFKADSAVIETLHCAIKGRRLVAFGGLFVKLRRELKLKDIEESNLINITETPEACTCPICQSTLREELYRWNNQYRDYVG